MQNNPKLDQRLRFFVILQEYPGWNASYRSVIVQTDGLGDVYEKAERTSAAEHHPKAIYRHSCLNARYDIGILQKELATNPSKQGFWCLVRDDSDNTFVKVTVTAKTIQGSIQAALDERRFDCKPESPADNCGFHVVWLMSLTELETLLVRLTPQISNA